MKTSATNITKLIIFFFSIVWFISYVIKLEKLNYISCIIFICLSIYLVILYKNESTKLLFLIYFSYSFCAALFMVVYANIEPEQASNFAYYDCLLVLLQIVLGYFILRHTQQYGALTTLFLILLNASSRQSRSLQDCIILITLLLFCTFTDQSHKFKTSIANKILIGTSLIILTTYNICFGFVLLFEIIYTILNKLGRRKTYFLYPVELAILSYELFIKNKYTVEQIWNITWNSFTSIFNVYSLYTIIIFSLGIIIYRDKLKIENGHALNLTLAIGISISFPEIGNPVLSFLLIATSLLAIIIPMKGRTPNWSNYLLLSYGLTISSMYLAEYIN